MLSHLNIALNLIFFSFSASVSSCNWYNHLGVSFENSFIFLLFTAKLTLRKYTNNRSHSKWRIIKLLECGCSSPNRDHHHSPSSTAQAPAHRAAGPAVNSVTEQGVVPGFSFLEVQDAPAQLLCQWGSPLAFSNRAGTFPVPLGEGRWL